MATKLMSLRYKGMMELESNRESASAGVLADPLIW